MLCLVLALLGATESLQPVNVGDIKVGGEIGRRIDLTIESNLLVIDLDKDFLAPFLARDKSDGYIGLGKTIDAMARLAAYSKDPRLIERKKKLVDALIASQDSDGYLGMFRPDSRTSALWDVHELSYIVLGLTSDYACCNEQKSLEAARKLGDYLIGQLTGESAKPVGPASLCANLGTTGLDEAMLFLADQTADDRYRQFVIEDRKLVQWRYPIVLGRWGDIGGHAYAYLAECLAQVRLGRHMNEAGLWQATGQAFRFLLDQDGLVISGTCGDHECWHDTQSGATNLGETCTTAYLVRLCDEILRQTGDPLLGDIMERAIYNALFAAQSPDGRKLRYYTPFEAPRKYFEGDTYCCPCNYRRILAELPAMIYYGRADGVYVNLYTSSSATVPYGEGKTVAVRQETEYPSGGHVALTIDTDAAEQWTLYLRVPRWAKHATVRVNGQEVQSAPTDQSNVVTLKRLWATGDKVEIDFPMKWRLIKGRKTQSGRAAIMRGPLVFTCNPERNPDLKSFEPRLLTLNPDVPVEDNASDDSVRPGGLTCKIRVWEPGAFYPDAPTRELILSEFADPGATSTYFTVPNPNSPLLVDDELLGMTGSMFR